MLGTTFTELKCFNSLFIFKYIILTQNDHLLLFQNNMNFWKLYAYSFKLPIHNKKNSLNFVQICSYQMIGGLKMNGKKNVLNSDSCIYERRCTIFKRASSEFEKSLKIKDKVPTDYSLIYRVPHTLYLKFAQYSVICSSGVGLIFIANKYISFIPMNSPSSASMLISEVEFNWFLLSLALVNIAIGLFVSKCPLRMYANGDGKYKSIFIRFLPWNLSTHSFTKGEVEKVEPFLTILPWSDSYFRINRKKVIFQSDCFRKPSDLHDMLK